MPKRRNAGFTLIEAMVAVVIIGIIATIAWPMFDAQRQRSKRTDAARGLTLAAIEMERCASDLGVYTDCDITAASPESYYNITAATTSDTFGLTATPVTTDADCATMTLNHLGQKGYTGDAPTIKRCWAQ